MLVPTLTESCSRIKDKDSDFWELVVSLTRKIISGNWFLTLSVYFGAHKLAYFDMCMYRCVKAGFKAFLWYHLTNMKDCRSSFSTKISKI